MASYTLITDTSGNALLLSDTWGPGIQKVEREVVALGAALNKNEHHTLARLRNISRRINKELATINRNLPRMLTLRSAMAARAASAPLAQSIAPQITRVEAAQTALCDLKEKVVTLYKACLNS